MNKEFRTFNISNDDESRKVGGYAIVFNSLSVDLGGFREIISPEAITQDLIDNSDVIFNFNHQNDIVLGRSRNGEGTLSLRLDDKGLYFECELPNSPMGDNIRESIKRGDISQCSFAFAINQEDEGAETWENREDGIYRTINRIAGLYDVSAVTFPAYEETSISERAKNILNDMKKEDIELKEDEVKEPEEEQEQKACGESEKEDERADDTEEKPEEETEDSKEEEKAEEPEDKEPEDKEPEEKETEEDSDEDKNNRNIRSYKNMKKRFSLLSAIRNIANGQQLNPAEQAVVNAGAEAMRNAGQSFSGQIQLPVGEELRADPVHYTVEADGEHVVVTDYLNILEPLKAKNVLVQAGATYLTGLKGNLQIPSMTAENVFWEGEIEDTDNGAGSFSHVNMAPRRLSAYIDISKQFLIQDTLGAENLIRKLLVEAINDKLEETILGEAASSGAKPAGLFYNVSATEVADYADICELESDLEDANFIGTMKYVMSPKAKAALRSMIKGTNATGMVMENDAVDGTPAEVTTNMATGKFAYGAWENLYIAQWGAIDLTVDNYTQATKGCVRLVINAFFDYKVVREGAIVYGEIASE